MKIIKTILTYVIFVDLALPISRRMGLFTKNMVSIRCELTGKYQLEQPGLHCNLIEYGKVRVAEYHSEELINTAKIILQHSGSKLIGHNKSILIEKIKNVIIEMLHHTDDLLKTNFSNYLSTRLNLEYTYPAIVFTEVQGSSVARLSNQFKKVTGG